MPKNIAGTVGRNAKNFPPSDVMTVQYLLNCVPAGSGGPTPELTVDGAAGPKTIAAIEKFQRAHGCVCDGRVDPGGLTLRTLQGKANDPYPNQPVATGDAKGPGGPFGQKTGFGQNFPGQPGAKGGPGDPFGQKVQPGANQPGNNFGQKTGGMPQGGGGFGFPQKGGGGAKGF